eukprot:gb/GEZN01011314.1/.p1 GENE.gb/GEZN01011314.1/~~gb/GEZN01011314.1/.p1  ORF type:complete len:356 (+),score=33.03 gb/GEZN01011314.1/:30-1070(+)
MAEKGEPTHNLHVTMRSGSFRERERRTYLPGLYPEDTYYRMAQWGERRINSRFSAQALQGVMAGLLIALGGMNANIVQANYLGMPEANLVAGAVFPFGLIAVFLSGANLFSTNCMLVVPCLLNGTVSRARATCFLLLSFFTNFIGAICCTYFFAHLGGFFEADQAQAHNFVLANAEKKLELGFGTVFLRGVGANFLVCLAYWQALSSNDTVSKIFGIWWPAFTFTAIGFEECISNIFYVNIGLIEGAEVTFGEFLSKSLIPVVFGNLLGGALLAGLVPYLSFDDNAALGANTGMGYGLGLGLGPKRGDRPQRGFRSALSESLLPERSPPQPQASKEVPAMTALDTM